LMDIKRGKFKLSEIKTFADEWFKKLDTAYEKSKLPEVNNKQKISKLLFSILEIETGLSTKNTQLKEDKK